MEEMGTVEQVRTEFEQFLGSISSQHFEPAPVSFFVKEMGWIHAKYYVPTEMQQGTESISSIDIIAVDGAYHRIKEEFIIDKRINMITPEAFEQFMLYYKQSQMVTQEGKPTEEPLYG